MDGRVSRCLRGQLNSLRHACWLGLPIHSGKVLPTEDKPVLKQNLALSVGNTFVLHRVQMDRGLEQQFWGEASSAGVEAGNH